MEPAALPLPGAGQLQVPREARAQPRSGGLPATALRMHDLTRAWDVERSVYKKTISLLESKLTVKDRLVAEASEQVRQQQGLRERLEARVATLEQSSGAFERSCKTLRSQQAELTVQGERQHAKGADQSATHARELRALQIQLANAEGRLLEADDQLCRTQKHVDAMEEQAETLVGLVESTTQDKDGLSRQVEKLLADLKGLEQVADTRAQELASALAEVERVRGEVTAKDKQLSKMAARLDLREAHWAAQIKDRENQAGLHKKRADAMEEDVSRLQQHVDNMTLVVKASQEAMGEARGSVVSSAAQIAQLEACLEDNQAEQAKLQAELKAVRAETASQAHSLDSMTLKFEAALKAQEAHKVEAERQAARACQLQEKVSEAAADAEQLEDALKDERSMRAQLRLASAAASKRLDALHEECTDLRAANGRLVRENSALYASAQGLSSQRDQLGAQVQRLQEEAASAAGNEEEVGARLAAEHSGRVRAESKAESARVQIAKLQNELVEMKADLHRQLDMSTQDVHRANALVAELEEEVHALESAAQQDQATADSLRNALAQRETEEREREDKLALELSVARTQAEEQAVATAAAEKQLQEAQETLGKALEAEKHKAEQLANQAAESYAKAMRSIARKDEEAQASQLQLQRAKQTIDSVKSELKTKLSALQAERERDAQESTKQRVQLEAERARLHDEVRGLEATSHKLSVELASLAREKELMAIEAKDLVAQTSTLREDNQSLTLRMSDLATECSELTEHKLVLREANSSLGQQRRDLQAETTDLKHRVQQLSASLSQRTAEKLQLTGSNAALTQQLEEVLADQKGIDELRRQNKSLWAKNTELRARVEELVEEQKDLEGITQRALKEARALKLVNANFAGLQGDTLKQKIDIHTAIKAENLRLKEENDSMKQQLRAQSPLHGEGHQEEHEAEVEEASSTTTAPQLRIIPVAKSNQVKTDQVKAPGRKTAGPKDKENKTSQPGSVNKHSRTRSKPRKRLGARRSSSSRSNRAMTLLSAATVNGLGSAR